MKLLNGKLLIMYFFLCNMLSFFSCNSQKFHIEPKFDEVMPFSNGIAAVKENNLWAFIDSFGNYVIKPRFSVVTLNSDGNYITEDTNVEYQQILEKDSTGAWSAQPLYLQMDDIVTSHGIRIIDKIDDKLCIFDENEQQISALAFESVAYIGNDLFICHDHYKGDMLIHANGKPLTPFYTEIEPKIIHGRLKFKQDRYSGLLNTSGKVVVEPTWWLLEIAGKNIACTAGGDLMLHTDDLKLLSDFKFKTISYFANGNWIGRNTDTGVSKLFDPDGKIITDAYEFGHQAPALGFVAAKNKKGNWGYLDENGDEVIPFTFGYTEAFMQSGKAFVSIKEAYGMRNFIIDTLGKVCETPSFDKIEWYKDGIYRIEYQNKNQLLDNNFKAITKSSTKMIEYLGDGTYAIYKKESSLKFQKPNFYTGDKLKLFTSRDYVIDAIFAIDGTKLMDAKDIKDDDPKPKISEGMAMAKKGNKWGFIAIKN